jgi:hypothetical protein
MRRVLGDGLTTTSSLFAAGLLPMPNVDSFGLWPLLAVLG